MADINSGLPVRTQLPGQVAYDDLIVKIGDGTTPSQLLGVDSAGLIGSKLYDGAGSAITSQANGAQQALDVGINVAGVQIDPRQIRALTNADVVTAEQGTSPWVTSVNNLPATVDTDYGVVGASTIRTAAQIGNDAGAAAFDFGASDAQTLRVAALLGNATGSADFNFGTVGAQTVRAAAQIGNATGAADFNFGAVGAQTLRAAAQIGNATGAADFNNGATGAQTLRVAANLAVAGADVSATNPVPVTISADLAGTEINNYNTASAVAAGASSNHDYTVTALNTLLLTQIEASGSGRAKIEVQIETGVASGVFNTRFVQFSSTAETNMSIHLKAPISVAAGVRVRVIRTNRDNQAQDLYSTISGQETT
ncbi:MAG: hypothetical protein HC840_00315 [Leptolyngbyaceae cyanobacterium RM2_2_4]|nr:hypothetical protein [Leptolyngbyaceae cyanobacterium RM2_2_4]